MNREERLYKKTFIPTEYVPPVSELNMFCEKSLQSCLNSGSGYAACITQVNSNLLNTYGDKALKPPRVISSFKSFRN